MKPWSPLLTALLMVVALACPGLSNADVLRSPVTLPNGLGDGQLFMSDDLDTTTAGIILVHESWGLNQYARDRARLLAKAGYVVLALDLYSGKVATHPNDAKALMDAAKADPQGIKARFDAAKVILRSEQYVDDKRLFAVGYGFGGTVVLNMARDGEDLAGVAAFSAPLSTDHPMQPGTFKGRVFIATGLADPRVPAQQIQAATDEMNHAGVSLKLLTFAGAKHEFTNPKADEYGRRFDLPDAYDPKADRISWQALLDFIKQS